MTDKPSLGENIAGVIIAIVITALLTYVLTHH